MQNIEHTTYILDPDRTYQELEDAINNSNSQHRLKYLEKRKLNLHKMGPIPVCKIPN